jgi:hypothetical protein
VRIKQQERRVAIVKEQKKIASAFTMDSVLAISGVLTELIAKQDKGGDIHSAQQIVYIACGLDVAPDDEISRTQRLDTQGWGQTNFSAFPQWLREEVDNPDYNRVYKVVGNFRLERNLQTVFISYCIDGWLESGTGKEKVISQYAISFDQQGLTPISFWERKVIKDLSGEPASVDWVKILDYPLKEHE